MLLKSHLNNKLIQGYKVERNGGKVTDIHIAPLKTQEFIITDVIVVKKEEE